MLRQLETVSVDQPEGRLGMLPELREVLGAECLLFMRLVQTAHGWSVEGLECDGTVSTTRARTLIGSFFATRPDPVPWMQLASVPAEQRNLPVRLADVVEGPALRASPMHTQLLHPLGLGELDLVRVVLWDDSVRGWLGAFFRSPATSEQCGLLRQAVGPLVSRMRIERLLGAAPRVHAALEATLAQIGAPALRIDEKARILEMNRAARDLLAQQREQVMRSLTALLEKRLPSLPFMLTPIPGAESPHFLAVLRPRTQAARISLAVTLASYRWRLTARQAEVLGLVVSGDSNASIGARLGITERAVELHVTSLFERAKVTSRSQLVAAVLLG